MTDNYMKDYLDAWKWYQHALKEFKKREPGNRTNEQETLEFILQHLSHLAAEINEVRKLRDHKVQSETYREIDSLMDLKSQASLRPNEQGY